MKLKLNDWPRGTPDFVNHRVLAEYIQDTSVKTGVHERTLYGTRVEKIEKLGKAWQVTTSTSPARNESLKTGERTWVRARLSSRCLSAHLTYVSHSTPL